MQRREIMEIPPTAAALLITEAEAAARLTAKVQTLRAWRHRQTGPPYLKLSGKIRYRVSDIDEFIETSRVVPVEKKSRRRSLVHA